MSHFRRTAWSLGWTLILWTLILCSTIPTAARAAEARLVGPAGKCLGVIGEPSERTPVVLAQCAASDRNHHQRWEVPPSGFLGEVKLGGFCLDVDQASSDNGTPLQLFRCHGGANQRWQLENRGRLVGLAGKCLDLANTATTDGTPAVLFDCQGQESQVYLAEPYEAWRPSFLPLADSGSRIVATSDPRIAYLHDHQQIRRTTDGGRTWASVGFFGDFGLVMEADARKPETVWRLGEFQELERSDDGGRSWRLVFKGELMSISALRSSKVDPTLVVAVGDTGFYLSRDQGQSFQRQGDLPMADPRQRRYPGELIETGAGHWLLGHFTSCGSGAGCSGEIWRTTDLGASWNKVADLLGSYTCHLASSAAHPSVIYGLEDSGNVIRSDDGGATFARVSRLNPDFHLVPHQGSIAPDPQRAGRVFVVFDGRLLLSEDAGRSWTAVAGSQLLDAGRPATTITPLGDDIWVVLTLEETTPQRGRLRALVSRDGGITWADEASGIAGGATSVVAGARPGLFYSPGHAAFPTLWRSQDHGRTWVDLPDTPCVVQVVADPVAPDRVYWSNSTSCEMAPDAAILVRSEDGGETQVAIPPPGLPRIDMLATVRQPSGATLLAAARYDYRGLVFHSADGGTSWRQVTVDPAYGILDRLVVDDQIVYAIADTGRVFRSLDGGATWAEFLSWAPSFVAGGGKYSFADGAGGTTLTTADGTRTVPRAIWQIDRHGRLHGDQHYSFDDGRTWYSYAAGIVGELDQVVADPFDRERLIALTETGPLVGLFTEDPSLVLGHGRFRATLSYRAPDGSRGHGKGQSLTGDTGGFWLFDPERTEVSVKILDGRAINGRFWVFVGSLTNVEFDLEVEDLLVGERWRYHNPPDHFASFGDTLALPLGAAQPAIASAPAFDNFPIGQPTVTLSSRFVLSVRVFDPNTHTEIRGLGRAISGHTAAFTFFSPRNLELLVNLIDGKEINGHDWVFAASMTNVHYLLEVRDLTTGAIKTYENPQGTFASFGDTTAF